MPKTDYSARNLTVLEGLEAVRKRPGMYIGSNDSRGLMHCLWEIIDNSVDEVLAGYGEKITVTLNTDGSVLVQDQGRGVPVDIEPRSQLTGAELVFTKLHAGGKFGGSSYGSSGGLHGVGASVVNALSLRMDVEIDRDGHTWGISFKRGVPGFFADHTATAEFTPAKPGEALQKMRKIAKSKTGTRVKYWADPQSFLADVEFDYEMLTARAKQTAFLVPQLTIAIVDQRQPETPSSQEFSYAGGIAEFVNYLAKDAAVTDTIRITDSAEFTETVPVLDESTGRLESREVNRSCEIDIALRWGSGYDTIVKSFVNIIATPKGGTHLAGFETGLLKVLRKQVEQHARKLKAGSQKPEKDDVLAGLTAIVTVRLPEPQFEGQTKEVLGTAAVRQIVARKVVKQLTAKFESSAKADKQFAQTVLEKVVGEMKSRLAARAQRDTQRRKNALENSSLPAKLVDCRSNDVANSELFIVEGDSALGTAKLARDSEYQALLPIRGKILNVQKASLADMLANAECANIIQVLGAGSGRSFDLSAARYGKVILMSDADVDGAHIRTLLLTLFFRYMRPLVDAGRVYAAVPPLHSVVVMHPGKKKSETVYTYSEAELNRLLRKLERAGKRYKEPIQRYKGLGEMDARQLEETTMDRAGRLLRRVTVPDAQTAERTFELLMGSEVAPRKNFIIAGSKQIKTAHIDA
ncbi:type IIA DNA topoisomerase subunit B [Canibacter sp. lx-72]|uniref:DNA gyrase/topoisomerase IV subunit B n=1 Tax=Canibacter zhuwentaonis TaxID=2837491 RepID=UPI001BDD5A8C|nr:DNA topoisomerase IV subunit B [Canibacter zhuwentaonis]MBT1017983.1 type IIA DNA topoisomerase subunit B [Canibacter zhuwentaonis]